jgi:general secretion pathway protein J
MRALNPARLDKTLYSPKDMRVRLSSEQYQCFCPEVAGKGSNLCRSPVAQGFTLVEILLAIFIFSIVLSAIYASYAGTFYVINATEAQAAVYRKARVALERIAEDLQSAYYSNRVDADEKFIGEERELMGHRADRLQFVSRSHLVFSDQESEAGKTVIVYEVREKSNDEGLTLYRHDVPDLFLGDEEGRGGLILGDGLEEVRFAYYGADGDEQSRWDSGQMDFVDKPARARIPRLVTITLRFINSAAAKSPYTFTTSVILPMSRGS